MTPQLQIVPRRDLTAVQARSLTDRIKSSMSSLMTDVAKAWQGRVWLALGYESWADYIKGEFGHAPLSLPREERQAVSVLLRGQGMSTRAIGAATGTSDFTVRDDLATARNHAVGESQQVTPVTGLDGRVRTYPTPSETSKPEVAQPAPPATTTCPTCGGSGKVTQ